MCRRCAYVSQPTSVAGWASSRTRALRHHPHYRGRQGRTPHRRSSPEARWVPCLPGCSTWIVSHADTDTPLPAQRERLPRTAWRPCPAKSLPASALHSGSPETRSRTDCRTLSALCAELDRDSIIGDAGRSEPKAERNLLLVRRIAPCVPWRETLEHHSTKLGCSDVDLDVANVRWVRSGLTRRHSSRLARRQLRLPGVPPNPLTAPTSPRPFAGSAQTSPSMRGPNRADERAVTWFSWTDRGRRNRLRTTHARWRQR